MNKQQATIAALGAIAALIRIHLEGPEDGDIYQGLPEDTTEEDRKKFCVACEEIANGLAKRKYKLKAAESEKREKGKPRFKVGEFYDLEWPREVMRREVKITQADWRGSVNGWWYGATDDHGGRYGFHERDVIEHEC